MSLVAPATLYVVATPIGNLGDLSPRAQAVLGGVTRIYAEDTRVSGALLAHFGINTPLIALHDHNEEAMCGRAVAELAQGASLALVSDAGTPLISDPGFRLVRAAREAQHPVIAIPGPSAVLAALSICGLPTDQFSFVGFLPARAQARVQALEAIKGETRSLVFYESSHRIAESVAALAAVLGATRPLFIGRELTKLHEESVLLPAGEAVSWLAANPHRHKGEFVLVAAGATTGDTSLAEGERVLKLLLEELPPSRAAKLAAAISGVARDVLYERAMALRPQA